MTTGSIPCRRAASNQAVLYGQPAAEGDVVEGDGHADPLDPGGAEPRVGQRLGAVVGHADQRAAAVQRRQPRIGHGRAGAASAVGGTHAAPWAVAGVVRPGGGSAPEARSAAAPPTASITAATAARAAVRRVMVGAGGAAKSNAGG